MIKTVHTIRTDRFLYLPCYIHILNSLLIIHVPARGFGAFKEDLDRSEG